MPVRLKDLNESFEKKYGLTEELNEEVELNEKLSDKIPDWLAKRLLVTKYSDNGNSYRRDMGLHKSSASAKNPETDYGKMPTYSKGKGSGAHEDQSLFGQMLKKGINLDTVDVISNVDVPTKTSDPRLKEPNIPIFLMKNGQVYAKGINDREEYKDADYKAFKYISMKTLLNDCEKFAYIDGTDDDNFSVERKQIGRSLMKNELDKIPNYERQPQNAGRNRRYKDKGWVDFDKSGYAIIPTVDKYKDKLAEIKCDKIHDILKEKEDYLNYVKEELSNILMNTDIKSDLTSGDSDFSQGFNALFDWFKDSARALVAIEYRLQDIFSESNNYSKDEQRKKVLDIINHDWDYSRLMENIRKIEKVAPTLFNSIIDWI